MTQRPEVRTSSHELVDYAAVFAATPSPQLLLRTDLTIVDANDAYLGATGQRREALVGQALFTAFPDNPDGPCVDAVSNLRASLRRALASGAADTMPPQRYDIPGPASGGFLERYWSPVNVPVLDESGRVQLLLHRVVDVTDLVPDRVQLHGPGHDEPSRRGTAPDAGQFVRVQDLHELNLQLHQAREDLATRALRDALTGVLVRPVLLEQLAHALAQLRRRRGCVAVLFLDLDRLKPVNDTYGHAAGDELLRRCAQRLSAAVRPGDTVARLGGDEFAVLLDGLDEATGADRAEVTARRLLESVQAPCLVAPGVVVHPSVSIGIATTTTADEAAPTHGGDLRASTRLQADEMLSRADTAMYRAKRTGPGRYHVFGHADDLAVTAHYRLEAELRTALAAKGLRVHYQPIVDLDTGAVHAVEALLRWQHPDGRLRPAAEFIEAAERAGLLPEIGPWVITEACGQLAAWDALLADRAPQRMFVNLSPGELARPDLHEHLSAAASAAGIAPQRLVLEVTETGMLDATRTAGPLEALRQLGCQFALDDFGTGHSSLSRLVHLPADIIKIDKSFLSDLTHHRESVAVVAAVLTLAHNLRKSVVAEGVEDAATLAVLQDLGCSYAQGYHLATPETPDLVTARLAAGPPTTAPSGR